MWVYFSELSHQTIKMYFLSGAFAAVAFVIIVIIIILLWVAVMDPGSKSAEIFVKTLNCGIVDKKFNYDFALLTWKMMGNVSSEEIENTSDLTVGNVLPWMWRVNMKGTEVVAVRRVLHTEKYFVTADERVIRPYGILFKKISILCLILSCLT